MRVLLIANTLPPRDVSGVGEQVLQLAAGLRELGDQPGDQVEVLGRGAGGAAGPKVFFPLLVLPAVWRALRRFRPHVVQVHESDGALAALLVAVVGALLTPRPLLVALLQVSYVEERRAVRPLKAGGRVLGRPGAVEMRFRWLKSPLQILLGLLTAWTADLVRAAGVPVVASAVSGIPEVVVDGETGWLVPVEDPRALEQALEEVLARPQEARRRGEAGRRRVDERFRPSAAAARWREVVLATPAG